MKKKKQSDAAVLLKYAGSYKWLTFLGLGLSAAAMILGMAPYICIWLVARDLISVAPDWTEASGAARYGWMAFGFAMAGIAVYFAALMCTHLAAFRTASNIRKQGMAHLMKSPLGYFDSNASGLIRNRLDGAASETETLLAHNLADIVGSAAMLISMIVLMFVFDWRMGAACLLAAAVSIAAMFSMMGGKNARLMAEYQAAQDVMSKAGTEYVRGIPVVKVFQQTVYSFRAFRQAIEDYSTKAEHYQGDVCRMPQAVNLTFTEGAFVFLVPVALILAPGALKAGDFPGFVTDFAFYAVFSAIISTALARVMFAASGMMQAGTALARIDQVMSAPVLKITEQPQVPKDNSVEFKDVSFIYDGSEVPALDHISFRVEPGQTVALVGPSGGGKTTAASLIPRFWDVSSGSVLVGGVDVRETDPHVLMDQVAFVFQNDRLFKASILENVRAARPEAARDEVQAALSAAQCDDILEKLPDGMETVIGPEGTHLSGGEQQRVALARAILKNAPIVVPDEATAFADPENEALIQKAFAVLTKGRTVIMIAHRLSTVVGADKIIVLAFLVLSVIMHMQQYRATYGLVYGEVKAVRIGLAERLRKLPLGYFGKRDLADLTETIMGDVNRLEHVWSHCLGYLYGSFISTAIIAAGMLLCSWRMAFACLWGVPAAFALLFGSRRLTRHNSEITKAAGIQVSDGIQEILENIREIRATNQEDRFLKALDDRIDYHERTLLRGELHTGIFVNAASVIMRLGVATTILAGTRMILSGRIDFMVLFMFLLAITRVYAPFDQALALIAEMFMSQVSAGRLMEIHDARTAEGTDSFVPAGHDIVFENVWFSYGADPGGAGRHPEGVSGAEGGTARDDGQVLRGVSFTAKEGEVTALVGPSGSGKSTCTRLAARLWDISEGSIRVGGIDISSVDPEVLLTDYSMVFQDVVLFDDTVMENIRLGRHGATDEEVLAAAAAANCDEFVRKLPQGYATPVGENGAKLSGGERQRISIARALLKNAPIVLLDEATASLDVENETKVQGALSRLLQGRTVLVIAHRMRTVEAADKIVVLFDGKVAEEGSPGELLTRENGIFRRMAKLQSDSAGWSI